MLTKKDLKAIGSIIDERVPKIINKLVPRIIDEHVPKIIDERVPKILDAKVPPMVEGIIDRKLKKALRGVARKTDLTAMENRMTRKLNFVIDEYDKRFLNIENRLDKSEIRSVISS